MAIAKILMVSLVDPATHPGGAGAYTRGLVAALRSGEDRFDVELVGPRQAPPGSWHRVRQALSLAQSCVSKLPAKALFARRHELRIRVREAVSSRRFDAVLINGSDMLWVRDELPPHLPTVIVAHNLEHQLLAQQLAACRILSPLLGREVAKHQRFEMDGFRLARGVVFVSAREMAWARSRVPGLRAIHVPPLFSTCPSFRALRAAGPLRLGYLADFSWWPNRENWSWLIEEVLPRVRRPLEVHVFGRGSEWVVVREGVVRHGMVRDLATVWNHADIMVCPTHVGAGVNIKLAESLHNRMPVLATTQAVGGLACASGPGIVVLDDAEDWAAFLDSPGAEQLADQMPSEQLCEQFSVEQYSGALHRFVRDTMREAGSCVAYTGSPPPTAPSLLSAASVGSSNTPLS
ncbi:MAG: glycosyltransferase family 4 protein [Nitrospira sp. CG24D]|nr:MAG: glycosyltransferase family 4 protein [Nitrospira sp. CG24D]